jgi:hypothetical protein
MSHWDLKDRTECHRACEQDRTEPAFTSAFTPAMSADSAPPASPASPPARPAPVCPAAPLRLDRRGRPVRLDAPKPLDMARRPLGPVVPNARRRLRLTAASTERIDDLADLEARLRQWQREVKETPALRVVFGDGAARRVSMVPITDEEEAVPFRFRRVAEDSD